MSDVVVTPAAAITVDPAGPKPNTPAPAVPAAAPTAPATEPSEKPSWLDARLEQARKSVLKDLGLESLEDGKKAIAAIKAEEDAKKSAAQKAAELETTLKSARAKNEEMAEALKGYAASQLSALTEAQRQAVTGLAGDDPAKQLKTIEALKPTWASAAAPAAPATPAPPKDTAPAPNAPKDAGSTSAAPSHKDVYETLLKTNPIIAARYGVAHGVFENK